MTLRRHWIIALIVIAVMWAGVAVVMRLSEEHVSSPEKIIALMKAAPWIADSKASVPAATRLAHIDRVVAQMGKLSFDQRRDLRDEGEDTLERFFKSLTPDEQKSYVDRTVQPHIDAMLKGLRAMSPDERKAMMGRARRDPRMTQGFARKAGPKPASDDGGKKGDARPSLEEEFADIAFEEYLRSATTEEKMKLAPLIEDMHTRVQLGRR
jgi:hypothetical protein